MKKIVFSTICVLAFLVSCQKKSESLESELLDIAEKLSKDTNHEFLKTLAPKEEDFYKIFVDSSSANKVMLYSKGIYDNLKNIPDDTMKPLDSTDNIRIISANKKDFNRLYYTGSLSSSYAYVSRYFKDNTVIYGISYYNAAQHELRTRSAFFRVDNKWVFIPYVYKVFS